MWGPAQEEAFQELREPLMKGPLLVYPDLTQPYILDTDASGFALGGVLSQVRDGGERVIAYSSKTLSRTERNYCTTKRELLGVVSMIHHFRPYLWGRTFTLRTDHAPLKWLLNFKDAEGMIARWAARIAHYNFELIHRSMGMQMDYQDAINAIMTTVRQMGLAPRESPEKWTDKRKCCQI